MHVRKILTRLRLRQCATFGRKDYLVVPCLEAPRANVSIGVDWPGMIGLTVVVLLYSMKIYVYKEK